LFNMKKLITYVSDYIKQMVIKNNIQYIFIPCYKTVVIYIFIDIIIIIWIRKLCL